MLDTAAAGAVIALSGYRLMLADAARYAGHGDPSFYYTLSQNLRAGRGPVIDYVWHFMPAPAGLTHYALDYWMPLPSVVMALFPVGGLQGAVMATAVWTALLAPLTWLLARRLSPYRWVPPVAAVAVLMLPSIARGAMRTDSIAYAAVGTTAALTAAAWAPGRRWGWTVAGGAVGVAMLALNGAALLGVPLVVAIIVGEPQGRRVRAFAMAAAGGFVGLAPLLVANLAHTGQLLVSRASRTLLMTDYNQIFAYGSQVSWHDVVEQPLGGALRLRITELGRVVGHRWVEYEQAFGWMLLGLAFVGWVLRRSARRHEVDQGYGEPTALWAVPGSFILVSVAAAALLVPHLTTHGSFRRMLPGLLPPLVVAALDGWGRVVERGRDHLPGHVGRAATVAGGIAVVVLLAVLGSQIGDRERASIAGSNKPGMLIAGLEPLLDGERRALGRQPVVMTRRPWETTEITGYATVSQPSNGPDAMRQVIDRYGVTHIVYRGHAPRSTWSAVTGGSSKASAFVGRVGRFRLYRLPSAGVPSPRNAAPIPVEAGAPAFPPSVGSRQLLGS